MWQFSFQQGRCQQEKTSQEPQVEVLWLKNISFHNIPVLKAAPSNAHIRYS
jgi:hypothetical protein